MAPQTPDHGQQLIIPESASREDLKLTLARLVEKGSVSAEKVKGVLDQIRTETLGKALDVSETELSDEQFMLLDSLQGQYPSMQSALERYEISIEGIPTWEQIKKGLTHDVLGLALKLANPTLILVPPTTFQSKIEAINKHPVKDQTQDIWINDFDQNLWTAGKMETGEKWRVLIVEGIENVPEDAKIYDGRKSNYEMSTLWVKKYQDLGLDVINDADVYLTLMMKELATRKYIDEKTFTVLNGKTLTKSSRVARAEWGKIRIIMSSDHPEDAGGSAFRLRGMVNVDIAEAA